MREWGGHLDPRERQRPMVWMKAKSVLGGKRDPASGGLQPLDYYQPL